MRYSKNHHFDTFGPLGQALEDLFNKSIGDIVGGDLSHNTPAVNTLESDDAYHLDIAVPGVSNHVVAVGVHRGNRDFSAVSLLFRVGPARLSGGTLQQALVPAPVVECQTAVPVAVQHLCDRHEGETDEPEAMVVLCPAYGVRSAALPRVGWLVGRVRHTARAAGCAGEFTLVALAAASTPEDLD